MISGESIAVEAAIASGAEVVLIPEIPFDIEKDVVDVIKRGRENGKKHHIVIMAEGISMSSADVAAKIQSETGVETRATVLGHVQRGGSPTLRDRVVASEMGHYAVELLEQGIGNRVVGMQQNKIVDFDIQEALAMKKPYDERLHHMAEEIGF